MEIGIYTHCMRPNLPQRDVGWNIAPTDYAHLASPRGSLFVGSPQEIADKILYEHALFGHHRLLAQIDIGGLLFANVARVIEPLALHMLPIVDEP